MDIKKQLKNLPKCPGVYKFINKQGKILYIGKATSLKDRVGSYFSRPLDDRLQSMVGQINKIEHIKTDSVLEALILEANLIKKNQPKYNVKEKDDKSFVNIVITKEEWPRIFIERENKINMPDDEKKLKVFGPYPSAKLARMALDIIRKIFTFCGNPGSDKECFYHQIGQCPGACVGEISKSDYKKNIRKIELFLKGEKVRVITDFEKEMKDAALKQNFEKAAGLRDQIFALRHIQDIALVGSSAGIYGDMNMDVNFPSSRRRGTRGGVPYRIEAYDISNISGVFAVGSMAVFVNGEINKNEYRKFRIKTVDGANDTAMLKEVFYRRFKHKEWPFPDLLLIDGGKGQLNAAREVLQELSIKNVAAISIAKGPDRKGRTIFKTSNAPDLPIKLIENLRDEAHRFAIKYHRLLRKKNMLK